MARHARFALSRGPFALLLMLTVAGCPPHSNDAPFAPPLPAGPHQLTVILDARPLHPNVATVTLLPGESMPLLDRASLPTEGTPPRFALRFMTHGAPVRWQAGYGTVVVDRSGLPGRARYTAGQEPGVDHLRVVSVDAPADVLAEITVLTLLPFERLHAEHLAGFRIGRYPHPPPASAPQARSPRPTVTGFIEITDENRGTRLSAHVRLRDLECKQDHGGFPTYMALDVRLLDKLERLVDLLAARGVPRTALAIMSGYRTPYYNRRIGNRTRWSRHLIGDAADVFVDSDGDGQMDDLDGDGRVSLADAEALLDLVDALDREPDLAGGAAAYPATPTHGPFVHLDTRGYRARW